jgi:hypothetical protein
MSDERSRRARPEPTKQEVNSQLMRERLLRHIADWYPGYKQKSPPALWFVAADGKLELWKCSLIPPNANEKQTEDMWLFWNTREVVSHSSSDDAFIDFVSELKSKRIEGKFQYCTSPLTVSAILAFLMLALIMGLLLSQGHVPDQLWSVFTAVAAFYFGRESGARSSETGVRE